MPLPQRSGSSGDSQIWVSHLQKGHREEEREAGVFLQGKSEHSHHSHLLTLNLRQKSRKQPGGKATLASPGTPAWVRAARPCFLSASTQDSWGP